MSNSSFDSGSKQQQQQQVIIKNGDNGNPSSSPFHTTTAAASTPTPKQQQQQQYTTTTTSPLMHCHNLLDKVFMNCSNDPIGNVHRTWAITLVLIVLYFIVSIFQVMHLHNANRNNNIMMMNNNNNNYYDGDADDAAAAAADDDDDDIVSSSSSSSYVSPIQLSLSSPALLLVCVWHGCIVQLFMIGCLGTFIMKRFPTSFAIGFLYGILIIFIQQNIIICITFSTNIEDGNMINRLYSALSLLLAIVLAIFGMLLFHFQKYIIVAPIDAKGFHRSNSPTTSTSVKAAGSNTISSSAPTTTYQRYDDNGSEA